MKLLPVLPLALAALFALPQANAADIKQNNINTCVNGAVKYKVADKNTATKLCKCTIGVRSEMTIGQMWEIESYAQDKRPIKLTLREKNAKRPATMHGGLGFKAATKTCLKHVKDICYKYKRLVIASLFCY